MRDFEYDDYDYSDIDNRYGYCELTNCYAALILEYLSKKSKKEKSNKYDKLYDFIYTLTHDIDDEWTHTTEINFTLYKNIIGKHKYDDFLFPLLDNFFEVKEIKECIDESPNEEIPDTSEYIKDIKASHKKLQSLIKEPIKKAEKPMSNFKSKLQVTADKVVGIVKSDTFNAGKRALSSQFFKTAKVPLQEVLKKNLNKISNEHVRSILTFILQSDIGDSILKIGVGSIMPHISINVTKQITSAVAEELRVQGYQGLLDKLSDTMVDPIRKVIRDSFSDAIPKVYPELIEVKEKVSFKNSNETVKESSKSN